MPKQESIKYNEKVIDYNEFDLYVYIYNIYIIYIYIQYT